MQSESKPSPVTQQRIAEQLRTLFATPVEFVGKAPELADLLQVTDARAVGCWSHRDGLLCLSGFLAVNEMPIEVQSQFIEATRSVRLTETQFGIVQAVMAQGPALNYRSESSSVEPVGSIGWLGRFEAASSLAIPVLEKNELRGTLAVATAKRIEPHDATWIYVTELAKRIFPL